MTVTETTPVEGKVPVRLLTKRQFGLLMLALGVLLFGTLSLVFGPGRGMRTDIVKVSDDLDASRGGIFDQLQTARTQLDLTERSLEIQEQGLQVAAAAEKDANSAARSSAEILDETRRTLALIRQVTEALGPLDQLDVKLDSVVRNVEQGVQLARATLDVAQRTLDTGQQALAVAKDTLVTLKRSEQLQRRLLAVAEETLVQTRELNRKIPLPPIFQTSGAATSGSAR